MLQQHTGRVPGIRHQHQFLAFGEEPTKTCKRHPFCAATKFVALCKALCSVCESESLTTKQRSAAGTACIALAALLSGLRATGGTLAQQRLLFYGAGEAGTGIAELIAIALHQRHGMSVEEVHSIIARCGCSLYTFSSTQRCPDVDVPS